MPLGRMDIKWYSKYVFLVGAILSFADPITDILTLVEFYRADHKTWFAVGLAFVVLPWFPFGIYNTSLLQGHRRLSTCAWLRSFLIGFNPFSAAVARLRMFIVCLRNCKNKRITYLEVKRPDVNDLHFLYSKAAAFFEAGLESAPQFVLQLYAISVQDEQVSIIQMISVLVSFLSLVWTFTSAEELSIMTVTETTDDIHVKHKVLLFATYLFLLSSRLLAVSYFTVRYKWWIISVLMFHSIIMAIVEYICSSRQGYRPNCPSGFANAVEFFGQFCVQWIRDDIPVFPPVFRTRTITTRWVSDALCVVENFVMVLLFYFSGHSNTWYALPVTVCVCSFTVLGAIMRVTHLYFLQKEKQVTTNVPVVPHLENNIIPSTNFEHPHYCYETAV